MAIAAIHHPIGGLPINQTGTPNLTAIRGGQDTEINNLAEEILARVSKGLKALNATPISLDGEYINPFAFTTDTASAIKQIVSHQ